MAPSALQPLRLLTTLLVLLTIVAKTSSLFNKMFKSSTPSGMSGKLVTLDKAADLDWAALKDRVLSTPRGMFLAEQAALREGGGGLPHTDAKVRLFGAKEGTKPRVVLYRDTAAWCPYCQKVWIMLEEKRIPYRVEKINMRSYGDKPPEYLRLVPNGLLPAVEIDGRFQTESIDIMLNLDRKFHPSSGHDGPALWPTKDSPEAARAVALMRLERELFGVWCNLVFRPSIGDGANSRFEACLGEVDRELGVTSSPWFLDELSIVDLQYITHIERMLASCAYWSGLKVRHTKWKNLDRWLEAFELRPSYMASKSDFYTNCMDIPPQYGPGFGTGSKQQKDFAAAIDGSDGSWSLPLKPFDARSDLESVGPAIDPGDYGARCEAAFKLVMNHENIAKFSLRAVGKAGAKQFSAPLADPYAVPDLSLYDDLDRLLKAIVATLIEEGDAAPRALASCPEGAGSALAKSLAYMRDRVGVPRDMGYPAARQLRAHINFVIDTCLA